jgi:1-aminocyclopropane-1-carboxylate deaminase/D-cysteine desulfhydrase-like pyridoxal-dependent ACC family enzyme
MPVAVGFPLFPTGNSRAAPARSSIATIRFDPGYEGKSMPRLMDLVRKGFFSEIPNLGEAPALNGYSCTYRND